MLPNIVNNGILKMNYQALWIFLFCVGPFLPFAIQDYYEKQSYLRAKRMKEADKFLGHCGDPECDGVCLDMNCLPFKEK